MFVWLKADVIVTSRLNVKQWLITGSHRQFEDGRSMQTAGDANNITVWHLSLSLPFPLHLHFRQSLPPPPLFLALSRSPASLSFPPHHLYLFTLLVPSMLCHGWLISLSVSASSLGSPSQVLVYRPVLVAVAIRHPAWGWDKYSPPPAWVTGAHRVSGWPLRPKVLFYWSTQTRHLSCMPKIALLK